MIFCTPLSLRARVRQYVLNYIVRFKKNNNTNLILAHLDKIGLQHAISIKIINNEGILAINMRKKFLQTIIHISHNSSRSRFLRNFSTFAK